MTRIRHSALLMAVIVGLSGCSTFNSLTGQTDDTVLPGQREDAIPGRAQFPDQPDPLVAPPAPSSQQAQQPVEPAPDTTTGQGCSADDPECQPPSGTDGVFSDPQ